MSLANKKFKNNKTGEVVTIIDSFEDLAILENKQKVSVTDLLNPLSYTEEIDPLNFFNNQGSYNILAEKIKSIPQEFIKDENSPNGITPTYEDEDNFRPSMNESAIIMGSEDDERAELAKKYGVSVDNTDSLSRQNEAFSKILGEDSDDLPKIPQSKYSQISEPEVQRIEANRDFINESLPKRRTPVIQQSKPIDPIVAMFRNVKRNVDFKMSVDISNKIPRLDFIEMMEDSYETSIIDFLAEEFTNNIIQNPEQIKQMISDRIKQIVYGGELVKKTKEDVKILEKLELKSKVEKPTPTSTIFLKEGEESKKPTRKPRAKKITEEK
jgi:hypothetical protein